MVLTGYCSLCFQVPAVADLHGITIVISPLLCEPRVEPDVGSGLTLMRWGIALMKNQVEALRGYGVKVHMLSSEATYPERQEVSRADLPLCPCRT